MSSRWRWPLRIGALGYLALLIVVPVGSVFYRAFEHGFGHGMGRGDHHRGPARLLAHPLGRPHRRTPGHRVRGRGRPDPGPAPLPGRMAAGRLRRPPPGPLAGGGRAGPGLSTARPAGSGTGWPPAGIKVIFSLPGIVMASATVALPYVVREVLPVLQEIGTEQEQAATTLGAAPLAVFRRITLPSIRRSLAYGVTLTTARVLGEFGAVIDRLGRHRRKDPDAYAVHPGQLRQPRIRSAPTPVRSSWPSSPWESSRAGWRREQRRERPWRSPSA